MFFFALLEPVSEQDIRSADSSSFHLHMPKSSSQQAVRLPPIRSSKEAAREAAKQAIRQAAKETAKIESVYKKIHTGDISPE